MGKRHFITILLPPGLLVSLITGVWKRILSWESYQTISSLSIRTQIILASYVRKMSAELSLVNVEELMWPKVFWINNLRGIVCSVTVIIHTAIWYVTNAQNIGPLNWDLTNVLNSASCVGVPLFFMIPGYLFFGKRSAKPCHSLRVVPCILFYDGVAPVYILLFISINAELSSKNLLQKPVFYHLWFFFAITVIYLASPLIQVKNISGKMLPAPMVVVGVIVSPNTASQEIGGLKWLPVNLYISGDTFYYILYGMLGQVTDMMDT